MCSVYSRHLCDLLELYIGNLKRKDFFFLFFENKNLVGRQLGRLVQGFCTQVWSPPLYDPKASLGNSSRALCSTLSPVLKSPKTAKMIWWSLTPRTWIALRLTIELPESNWLNIVVSVPLGPKHCSHRDGTIFILLGGESFLTNGT